MTIIADARKVSPAEFCRALSGQPPMSEAEVAERQARAARVDLIITIEKVEFARANREREAVIREGQRDGETYDDFKARLNAPIGEARKRVRARTEAFDAKLGRAA